MMMFNSKLGFTIQGCQILATRKCTNSVASLEGVKIIYGIAHSWGMFRNEYKKLENFKLQHFKFKISMKVFKWTLNGIFLIFLKFSTNDSRFDLLIYLKIIFRDFYNLLNLFKSLICGSLYYFENFSNFSQSYQII